MKKYLLVIAALMSLSSSAFAEFRTFRFDSVDENIAQLSGEKLKSANIILSSGETSNFKLTVRKLNYWPVKSLVIRAPSDTLFELNSVSTSQKVTGYFESNRFEEFRDFVLKVDRESCKTVIQINIDMKTKEILNWSSDCKK